MTHYENADTDLIIKLPELPEDYRWNIKFDVSTQCGIVKIEKLTSSVPVYDVRWFTVRTKYIDVWDAVEVFRMQDFTAAVAPGYGPIYTPWQFNPDTVGDAVHIVYTRWLKSEQEDAEQLQWVDKLAGIYPEKYRAYDAYREEV